MISPHPFCSSYITADCANAFLIAQGPLLTLRHMRRAFVKFLQLHVPHVLRRNADPTAEDFAGARAGIFPLVAFF